MDDKMKKDGDVFTFSQYFRNLFGKGRIKLFALIGLIAIVACFFLLHFTISQSGATYYFSYEMTFPNLDEGRYPDGTQFHYLDIISENNLVKVQKTDPAFAEIDVKTMSEKDDVSITYELKKTTVKASADEELERAEHTFKISVSQKYFTEAKVASEFLRAIAESPVTYIKNVTANLDLSTILNTYDSAKSFAQRIDVLASQMDYILAQYDFMINEFGTEYSVGGETVVQHRLNASNSFNTRTEYALRAEAQKNGYISDVTHAKEDYNALVLEQKRNQTILDNMGSMDIGANEELSDWYLNLLERQAQITSEIDLYKNYLTDGEFDESKVSEQVKLDSTAFGVRLDAEKVNVENATKEFREVYSAYYGSNSIVRYATSGMQSEGGLSLIVTALASVVGGVVIAFVATWVIYLAQERKRKPKATSSEN